MPGGIGPASQAAFGVPKVARTLPTARSYRSGNGDYYEPATQLAGVTRDSNGAALAGCTVTLFRVVGGDFVQEQQIVSDANGVYQFNVAPVQPYRVTWDLDGAPVRAGISLKTLTGASA